MTVRRALMVILLVLSFSPALFSAETLVMPETGAPIEICPSCTEVRVLLVPDCKSKIKLDEGPKVEAVYFSGAAPRNADKFRAEWIGDKFPREINVLFNSDETKQAGTYDLYLNLQPDSHQGAGRLKIQLTRPAASLEAIPKLIIDRTYWFIRTNSDSLPVLRVTETSKKSRITISGIRPVSNAVIGTRPIGGTLRFTQVPPEIKPGDQVTLGYKLDGSFEPGTATGTMKIDAPQLASPVSFEFEVRSHAHWIWIGITILVALLASYFVKVKLQKSIELGQARLDAEKLIERITLEEGRHVDRNYTKGYQDAREQLITAVSGDDANDINNKKVALDTAWQKALQDLAKRHRDSQDAVDKLHDLVIAYNWRVPPVIVKAVEDARAKRDEIEGLIDRDDLEGADDKLKTTTFNLGQEIGEKAYSWQKAERDAVSQSIQPGQEGIPATIHDLAKATADLLASLNKVVQGANPETPEQIRQSLEDIRFERDSVVLFVEWLSDRLQETSQEIAHVIPSSLPGWDALKVDKAQAAFGELQTALKGMVDDPKPSEIRAQLEGLHKAWREALLGQFPGEEPSVEKQLAVPDYIQAAVAAVQKKTTGAAGTSAAAASPAAVAPPFLLPAAAALPMSVSRTLYQTVTMPAPAVPTSVTDKAALRRDKAIQSLVLALLLVVAGYGLQLGTFVGTFTDFSTLFFWAFALDLTVDQVGKIAKKV